MEISVQLCSLAKDNSNDTAGDLLEFPQPKSLPDEESFEVLQSDCLPTISNMDTATVEQTPPRFSCENTGVSLPKLVDEDSLSIKHSLKEFSSMSSIGTSSVEQSPTSFIFEVEGDSLSTLLDEDRLSIQRLLEKLQTKFEFKELKVENQCPINDHPMSIHSLESLPMRSIPAKQTHDEMQPDCFQPILKIDTLLAQQHPPIYSTDMCDSSPTEVGEEDLPNRRLDSPERLLPDPVLLSVPLGVKSPSNATKTTGPVKVQKPQYKNIVKHSTEMTPSFWTDYDKVRCTRNTKTTNVSTRADPASVIIHHKKNFVKKNIEQAFVPRKPKPADIDSSRDRKVVEDYFVVPPDTNKKAYDKLSQCPKTTYSKQKGFGKVPEYLKAKYSKEKGYGEIPDYLLKGKMQDLKTRAQQCPSNDRTNMFDSLPARENESNLPANQFPEEVQRFCLPPISTTDRYSVQQCPPSDHSCGGAGDSLSTLVDDYSLPIKQSFEEFRHMWNLEVHTDENQPSTNDHPKTTTSFEFLERSLPVESSHDEMQSDCFQPISTMDTLSVQHPPKYSTDLCDSSPTEVIEHDLPNRLLDLPEKLLPDPIQLSVPPEVKSTSNATKTTGPVKVQIPQYKNIVKHSTETTPSILTVSSKVKHTRTTKKPSVLTRADPAPVIIHHKKNFVKENIEQALVSPQPKPADISGDRKVVKDYGKVPNYLLHHKMRPLKSSMKGQQYPANEKVPDSPKPVSSKDTPSVQQRPLKYSTGKCVALLTGVNHKRLLPLRDRLQPNCIRPFIPAGKATIYTIKTTGPEKVEASQDKCIMKHSTEKHASIARKPPVFTMKDPGPKIIRHAKNFVKAAIHQTLVTTKPKPACVDWGGQRRVVEDSGQSPKFMKKNNYGEVPDYLLQHKIRVHQYKIKDI